MTEIEAYIESLKEPLGEVVCQRLNDLYSHLKRILPEATECISYGMPCFKQNNKPVVYFAGYKKHIGFYPTAKPITHFKVKLHLYKNSKGAIQFPLNQPLPKELIKEIIEFKVHSL